MIITTTDSIPNKEVVEILGIARGSTVRARNIGRDIFAGLKNIGSTNTTQPVFISTRHPECRHTGLIEILRLKANAS